MCVGIAFSFFFMLIGWEIYELELELVSASFYANGMGDLCVGI